jgi:ABC-type Fe3+ transport system substrate-binding protein
VAPDLPRLAADQAPDVSRGHGLDALQADLADPQWRGKVGVANYTSNWAELAFIRGKDKTFSELKAILKNKAIQGRYVDLLNRYLLGEITIDYSIKQVYMPRLSVTSRIFSIGA